MKEKMILYFKFKNIMLKHNILQSKIQRANFEVKKGNTIARSIQAYEHHLKIQQQGLPSEADLGKWVN